MFLPRTIIFSIITGLLSGIIGALLVFQVFTKPVAIAPTDMPLAVRVSTAGAVEQFKIAEAMRSLLFIYTSDKTLPISFSEVAMLGLALTNDGLIVIPKYIKTPANFLAASLEQDSFAIEFARDKQGAVFSNSESGLTFFKMKSPDGKTARVKPIEFYPFEDGYIGQTVFSFDQTTKEVSLHKVIKIGLSLTDPRLPISSDVLVGVFTLSQSPKAGTFIFSADGNLLGIVLKDGAVFPAEFLGNMLKGYLKTGKYTKTELGLRGLDLSQFIITGGDLPTMGFLIQDIKGRPAATSKDSIDQDGLKKGDVIVSFDGHRLSQYLTLQLLLQRYQPGTEVEMEVWRAGAEKKISVVL